VYLGIRYGLLGTNEYKPDRSKEKSVLDLRPSIIAKMQQLVKDGSGGLYRLTVEQVEPHLSTSSLQVINASISPDSAAIKSLNNMQQLPDDIFRISFCSLQVEGIGIRDIIAGDKLSLSRISINNPVIEIYHKKRNYDRPGDTLNLYQKISKHFKKIMVSTVAITDATIISHNKNKGTQNRVDHVNMTLNDILVDSASQYDRHRKLFANRLELDVKNYSAKTPDGLYQLKFGAVHISGTDDKLTASNVELKPALSRQQFQARFATRKEMFYITIPAMNLTGINWWLLMNEGALTARYALMKNARCSVYLSRAKPFRKVKPNNFPHQMILGLPVPIAISKISIRNAQLVYTEYNPGMEQTGTITVDRMHGETTNITNIPDSIRKNNFMTIRASGMFLGKVPLTAGFRFNLARAKTGDFSMNLEITNIDSSTLNRITIPMAEFMLKKGIIQKGIAQVSGNNYKTHGTGVLLYTDLYLIAVKKDKNEPGQFDKKSFLSRIANTVLIKNNNPSGDKEPRTVDFDFNREPQLTFFSLIWKTIYIGILKIIGLPESFANRSY
jgi:hypothetical protein